MQGKDGADRRKRRLREIERIIARDNGVHFNALLGFVEYSTGLTEAKIRSYLKILERAGRIYEKGMKIYVKKQK